jgi:peptidyl-prolyl cis-trans isomerase SurA
MVRFFIAAFLVLFFLDGAAQKSKNLKTQTLFTIGEEPVSANEFEYLYKKNHQDKAEYTSQKIDEYLKLYINFKLKVREARSRGIDTTAAFLKEYETYKEELKKPYLPEGKLIDSLVKVTYQRLQEEVRASHILISLKADATPADTLLAFNKALDIKAKALAGEDFGSLAALYSEEPMAKSTKGDLGYFTALQMVYPFENAAYLAKKGEIIGPVRTRFGYHILNVADRKPSRGEVEVSHIMIRTGNEHDATKARNLIFEIDDQLKGGVNWNDLCRQYSEDPATKNSGGKLRPFGVGAMASVPAFDKAAFSLQNPGDLSDPVQTQYGWHIIRLERKIPLPSFEELAPNLKSRIARDERAQVSRLALMKKLKKDFSFAENQEIKTKVFALADTFLTKGRWNWTAQSTTALNDKTLFTLKSKSVSALSFLTYVKQNQGTTNLHPSGYMEQLYNAFVEREINHMLETKIIQEHPDFEMLLKEYYEGILLFDIMEKEVWQKASDDSAGQQNFFNTRLEKYSAGERVNATIYALKSPQTGTLLKGAIERNDSTTIRELIQSKAARSEEGIFQKDDRQVLSVVEWSPGLYAAENNGMYYLVQIKEMVPPGNLKFDEARAMVISDYQDHLEKEWISQLNKKYPVKINEKARKYVVEKLSH